MSITHLRDQYILSDEERTLREASALVDRQAKKQHRHIAEVGGSDSHGAWLRATTFVLAKERSREAIHDALVEGRTCVRSPEACTLEVAAETGEWHGLGESVVSNGTVMARLAVDGVFLVDGAYAAAGRMVTLSVPKGRCVTVRATTGLGWSSAIYINC